MGGSLWHVHCAMPPFLGGPAHFDGTKGVVSEQGFDVEGACRQSL